MYSADYLVLKRICIGFMQAVQEAKSEAVHPARVDGVAESGFERYHGLTIVRMFAAFFVVLNHTTSVGLPGAPWFVANLVSTANSLGWRVPFFLLLTGFLFGRGIERSGGSDIAARCNKNLKRIALMWIAWSVIYLLDPPVGTLLRFDISGLREFYAERWSAVWPEVLWIGGHYVLWFLASLIMIWSLLLLVNRIRPGVLHCLRRASLWPVVAGICMAVVTVAIASLKSGAPESWIGRITEIGLIHLLLPFSFVIIGVGLWHQRRILANVAVIVAMLCTGLALIPLEDHLSLCLHGTGPRALRISGLLMAIGAIGIGLRSKAAGPLQRPWSLSPGVYCAHALLIAHMGSVFGGVHHWSAPLLMAFGVFLASISLSIVLDHFKATRGLVR